MHKYPQDRAEVCALLKQNQISPTRQRVQVASILLCKDQHMTADDVLSGVNKSQKVVSKATVYNTLGLFVQKGLAREVLVNSERVYYDSNVRPHHHIYNTVTGELTDVPQEHVRIEGLPAMPSGTRLGEIDLIIKVNPK